MTPGTESVELRSRDVGTGVLLSELGFGAAQLGNLHRATSDEESAAAVDAAWAGGIRYFDTAPHYGLGLSESRLGASMRLRPRHEYAISTKVGRLLDARPGGEGEQDSQGFAVPATHVRRWDFSRDGVLASLESSLDRLGLDRVDVVYVHDPDDHEAEALAGAIPALIELREQGVVGAVGLGMNQSAMPARVVERADIDVVMLAGRYTLLEQPALDDLLPVAEERGVAIVAAAVYNSGLLATDRIRPDATYDYGPVPAALRARTERLAAVSAEFGVTVPQAAVQFALRHPAVASVVVGARTAGHVDDALSRYRHPVPDDYWTALIDRGILPPDVFGRL